MDEQSQIAMLQQQVAALMMFRNPMNQTQSFPQNSHVLFCERCCQPGHAVGQCQLLSTSAYQVNTVQNQGQYSPVICQLCDNVGHTSPFCPMGGQSVFSGQQYQSFNNQFSGHSNFPNQGFNFQNPNFYQNPNFSQDQDINFSNQNQSWSGQSFPQHFHNSQGPSQSDDFEAKLEEQNNNFHSFQKEQDENFQLLLSMLKNLERRLGKMAQDHGIDLAPPLLYDREEVSAMNLGSDIQLSEVEVSSSPPTWCDAEDGCPMIEPTLEMVEDVNHQEGEEIHPVLENIEDTVPELEISHPEEVTTKEPLEPKSVEVVVDKQVSEAEVIFPLDHYILDWDVEAPNPVLIFLGRYFTKVPRAKARRSLYRDEMDGSYSEYSLKNHARKTYPFDNG